VKRRFTVEVLMRDDDPGAPLSVLVKLAEFLEQLKAKYEVLDYGLGFEMPVDWLVKLEVEKVDAEAKAEA